MNKITIAIADDHKYLRGHISETLTSFGYSVILQAAHGKELIDGIAEVKRKPDLCIIDINMPIMDGFIATREIKKRWPDIKILAYSINDEKSIIDIMLQTGADCFLKKDTDPKILNNTIKNLFKPKMEKGNDDPV